MPSLDISGPLDAVPHHLLASALGEMGLDKHILRYVGQRLGARKLRVRLRTAVGDFKSKDRPISRGLPRGGVLSPLLWLVFFNDLPTRRAAFREEYPEIFGRVSSKDLIYAGDITAVFACRNAHKLVEIARKMKEGLKGS